MLFMSAPVGCGQKRMHAHFIMFNYGYIAKMKNTKKDRLADEAGAWRHFLVQELCKRQNGENYQESLLAAGLRHVQRYCSDEACRYYMDLYHGQRQPTS